MLTCPSCTQKIEFRTIAFAAFPVWLTCPHCGTKLRGGALIKAQGFCFIPLFVAAPVIFIMTSDLPRLQKIFGLVLVVAFVSITNILVTLRWGRYFRRDETVTRGVNKAV